MKSIFLVLVSLPLVLTGSQKSLGPDQVARLDGAAITLREYKDFLYLTLAQSRLDDFLEFSLLRQEAKRLGVMVTPQELQKSLAKEIHALQHKRFSGNREKMAQSMINRGYTMAEMERWMAFDLEKRLLQDRVILASRNVTPEQIKRKFDSIHGLDGVRVQIRQIQISFGPLLNQELAKGTSIAMIDRPALEKRVHERALRIWKRIEKNKDFGRACLDESDEPAAKAARGKPGAEKVVGLVRNYNYQQFGGAFADAVRGLGEGQISKPVAFKSQGNLLSYHIIKLEKRTITSLDKVRDRVISQLKAEEPTFYERLGLKQKLLGAPGLITRAKLAGHGKEGDHQHK